MAATATRGTDATEDAVRVLPLVRPTVVVSVSVDELSVCPQHPREHFDPVKLKQLADCIEAQGLVEPLVLTPDGEVLHGARRLQAARLAGLKQVPAIPGGSDSRAAALVTMIHHQPLTTLEEVKAVTALAEEIGVSEAARKLGRPPQWVTKRKAVGTAPPFVFAFAQAGGSRDLETLYELARLAVSHPERARQLIVAGGPKSLLRVNARRARRGEPELIEKEDAPGLAAPEDQTNAPSQGDARPNPAKAPAGGFNITRLHLNGDELVFETGTGARVSLHLSPELERELLEALRERLFA